MALLSKDKQQPSIVPGLVLVALLTLLTYYAAQLPPFRLFGTLVLALVVGLVWRLLVGVPERLEPGRVFAAKPLLKLGIVLLGVRLNFALLVELGWLILLTDFLVVLGGLVVIERLGYYLGLSRSLRLAVAVGTSICGASAIVAAVPVIKAKEEDAGIAVGVISLVGTVGVVLFTLAANLFAPSDNAYALLVGATLQEVGQVVAAGYAFTPEAGDIAVVVKLARVALLAPALLVLNLILSRLDRRSAPADLEKRPALLPPFLLGFFVMGLLNSFGVFSAEVAALLVTLSLALTAAAMTAIGLGIDLSAFKRVGAKSLLLGAVGFVFLLLLTLPLSFLVA